MPEHAYPSWEWVGGEGRERKDPIHGMSLRDYFAGQVIVGITTGDYMQSPEQLAKAAYDIADAMLEERGNVF